MIVTQTNTGNATASDICFAVVPDVPVLEKVEADEADEDDAVQDKLIGVKQPRL